MFHVGCNLRKATRKHIDAFAYLRIERLYKQFFKQVLVPWLMSDVVSKSDEIVRLYISAWLFVCGCYAVIVIRFKPKQSQMELNNLPTD